MHILWHICCESISLQSPQIRSAYMFPGEFARPLTSDSTIGSGVPSGKEVGGLTALCCCHIRERGCSWNLGTRGPYNSGAFASLILVSGTVCSCWRFHHLLLCLPRTPAFAEPAGSIIAPKDPGGQKALSKASDGPNENVAWRHAASGLNWSFALSWDVREQLPKSFK